MGTNGESSQSVAALIATMDRPDFVERALESVCNQRYEHIEVVVVDASSDKQTKQIVDTFRRDTPDMEWEYIYNESPQGLPAARNQAAAATDAAFLAFLDDDDRWQSDKIAKQRALFRANSTELGVVHTGYEGRDERSTPVSSHIPEYERFDLQDILGWNVIMTPSTVMVRREPFENIGGFDEDLRYCADWDFYIRMAQECQFNCLSEPLVDRTYHDESMMTDLDRFFHFRERVIEKHQDTLEEHGMADEVWKRHYRKTAETYLQAGQKTKATDAYRNSLSVDLDVRTAVAYLLSVSLPEQRVLPALHWIRTIEDRIRSHGVNSSHGANRS